MAFDLSEVDLQAEAEKGATLHLLHPKTGEKTGVTFGIVGVESKTYRDTLRRLHREAMKQPDLEPEDDDQALILDRARRARAAIRSWHGVSYEGQTLEFNDQNAIELMTKRPWIADQVLAFAATRGNFGNG